MKRQRMLKTHISYHKTPCNPDLRDFNFWHAEKPPWRFSKVGRYEVDLDMANILSIYTRPLSFIFFKIEDKVCKNWKILKNKGQKLLHGFQDFPQNCRVGRSWHSKHFINLHLTSIFYSFRNKRQSM